MEARPWEKYGKNGRIKSCFGSQLFIAWPLSIIFNTVAIALGVLFLPQLVAGSEAENLKYLIYAFLFFGGVLAIFTIAITINFFRYRKIILEMDPFPGSIGGNVGGRIVMPSCFTAAGSYSFSLNCARVTKYSVGRGEDRRSGYHRDYLLDKQTEANVSETPSGIELSFVFNLPQNLSKDLPESTPRSNDYFEWTLGLRAKSGKHFIQRDFIIPVFKTAQKSKTIAAKTQNRKQQLGETALQGNRIEKITGGSAFVYPMFKWSVLLIWALIMGGVGVGVLLLCDHIFNSDGMSFFSIPFLIGLLFVDVWVWAIVFGIIIFCFSGVRVEIANDQVAVTSLFAWIPWKKRAVSIYEIEKFDIQKALFFAKNPGGMGMIKRIHIVDRLGNRTSASGIIFGEGAAEEFIKEYKKRIKVVID
ncbi:MAG: hypothetical protein D6B27_05045 [Gammaproteobacteria bacterium]|nr:MAG: hypothetical protein D6B27_05045 [Gammaproteobacteria bacterium]